MVGTRGYSAVAHMRGSSAIVCARGKSTFGRWGILENESRPQDSGS